MPKRSPRGFPIASVALAGLALGLAAVGRGEPPRPQDPAAKADAPKVKLTERFYLATTCKQCHSSGPQDQKPVPPFVKHDEFKVWHDSDKHSKAFEVLKGEDAKRMNGLMGYDGATDARCLSCHAPAHADPQVKDKAEPLIAAELIADGVSCASCHGPYPEWVKAHAEPEGQEKWIARTAAEKSALGMNNLRDPAERTRLCASCHVGDAKQGRVVTHDMYAAGHPPLPGLEVATFSEAEPPHWSAMKNVPYLNQTDEDLKKKFGDAAGVKGINFEVLRRQYRVDQFPTQNAKLVAVGGVVSFREALNLFAETGAAYDGKTRPDFARFDCTSCHHELAESATSSRQSRGFASDPGRPPAPDWPEALVSIGISAGDPAKVEQRKSELAAGMKRFHQAVGSRPFGDPGAAVSEAKVLTSWADGLIKELDAANLDRNAAIRMLKQITTLKPADHASARQLVWGFRAIYNELAPRLPKDREISATIQQLMDVLGINLTPGQQGTIQREVGARVDADEKFDSAAIGKLLDTLRKLLGP